MNVASNRQQLLVAVDRFAFEAALEKMPRPATFGIEVLSIGAQSVFHAGRDCIHWPFKKKVDMIAHQAPCVHLDGACIEVVLKRLKKVNPICSVIEDQLAP